MRRFVRLQVIAAVVLVAICTVTRPAAADSITQTVSGCNGCKGYSFQATLQSLGSNNYSLSYTISNISGSSAYAQTSALVPFQFGNSINSVSNFSVTLGQTSATNAYLVVGGASTLISNGLCDFNFSDSVCVTPRGVGSPSSISMGQSLTFSFNFKCTNCTQLNNWDFLAYGTCANGNGVCYAIGAAGTPAPRVGVPEPSVLALLASEMGLMAGVVLVFGPVRNRFVQRWTSLFRLQPRLTS
jgi:hypothetical protein